MESKKITCIQMNAKIGDKKTNFEKVKMLIDRDVDNADIIVLPEVWSCGWSPKIFRESAENLNNSKTIEFLSNIAQEQNSWIIGGSIITENNGHYYNTCPVLNRKGELVTTYSKNHLFSYYEIGRAHV